MDKSKGHMRTLTHPAIKFRMECIEDDILFALYSLSQTGENETHLECLKQLRTALSELSDDSIKEVPEGSWETVYVPKGQEGVRIEITPL